MSSCLSHARVAKLYLRCPEAARLVKDNTPNLFGLMHVDDRTLCSSSE